MATRYWLIYITIVIITWRGAGLLSAPTSSNTDDEVHMASSCLPSMWGKEKTSPAVSTADVHVISWSMLPYTESEMFTISASTVISSLSDLLIPASQTELSTTSLPDTELELSDTEKCPDEVTLLATSWDWEDSTLTDSRSFDSLLLLTPLKNFWHCCPSLLLSTFSPSLALCLPSISLADIIFWSLSHSLLTSWLECNSATSRWQTSNIFLPVSIRVSVLLSTRDEFACHRPMNITTTSWLFYVALF